MSLADTFARTRKALEDYDAGKPQRDEARAKAKTPDDLYRTEGAENQAMRTVQQAYFEDAKKVGSIDDCWRMGIEAIRKAVGV